MRHRPVHEGCSITVPEPWFREYRVPKPLDEVIDTVGRRMDRTGVWGREFAFLAALVVL